MRAVSAGGIAALALASAIPALAASPPPSSAAGGTPAAQAAAPQRQVLTLRLEQRIRLTNRIDYQLGGTTKPSSASGVRIQLRTATGWRTVATARLRKISATRSQFRVRLRNPHPGIYRASLIVSRPAGPVVSGLLPVGVTETAIAPALTAALVQEHVAEATYANVIATLGGIAPFTNVRSSEQQHIATLEKLAALYAVVPPIGPFVGEAAPATRTAACRLGVTVEQSVIALYDRLLPTVSAYPSVSRALNNLRTASQDDHLPAFQHCS